MSSSSSSDNSDIVNICDEEEDDDDSIEITLKFNDDDSILLDISYSQLRKESQIIRSGYSIKKAHKILPSLIQQYVKEYDIDKNNIIIFNKFLGKKDIEITNSNYCDLFKLASLLKIIKLNRLLQRYVQKHSKDISFIILLINERKMLSKFGIAQSEENDTEKENILINQIDQCLKNDSFNELPFPMILRIIEKSDKSQINDNDLYDFIMKKLDERYVLFKLITVEELSENRLFEINDNYSNEEFSSNNYFSNIGKTVKYYLNYLETQKYQKSNISMIEQENDEMQQQIKELNEKLNESLENQEAILQKNKDYTSKINELKNKKNYIQSKLNKENKSPNGKNIYYEMVNYFISKNIKFTDVRISGVFKSFFSFINQFFMLHVNQVSLILLSLL